MQLIRCVIHKYDIYIFINLGLNIFERAYITNNHLLIVHDHPTRMASCVSSSTNINVRQGTSQQGIRHAVYFNATVLT
jgi:hypothetical protein